MRKLTRGFAATLALTTLTLAGCGGKPAENNQTDAAGKTIALNFYYPIAVGGSAQTNVEKMVADFNAANPTIKVTPVFAGSYTETMTKV